MKSYFIVLLFLPILVASLETESDNEGSPPYTNSTEEGEFDNEFQKHFATALEEEHAVQWDIDAPQIVLKKAAAPPRGKVLEKIVLTKDIKNAIVMAHNRARSTTKPPSSNMMKMTWDNSLEKLATAYTRKCIYEHNPDAVHNRFSYVGENLFISMGLPYDKKLLQHAVKAWDEEDVYYNYNTLSCQRGKVCGHYTQVVWADSFKVGCGVTRCGNIDVRGRIWKNAILFGCNYGPGGNYRGEKPYKKGAKCKQCHNSDQCAGKLCTNNMRDRIFFNPKMAKWTPWSKWSPCSVSCGSGSQRRERNCNTFVPTDCTGYQSEVRFCTLKPCKAKPKQQKQTFEITLRQGDHFDPDSLLALFRNNPNMFTRTG